MAQQQRGTDGHVESSRQGVYGTGTGVPQDPRESTVTLPAPSRPANVRPGPTSGAESALMSALRTGGQPHVAPVRGFDSALNQIFSSVSSFSAGERFIVAKASTREIEDTVSGLRDLFGITEQSVLEDLLGQLLVWFGDNSTSTQTPHRLPFAFNDRVIPMGDVVRCFRPDPRRFWRSLADVTRNFLILHPDVTFNWATQHGFPPEFRTYGFDTADFCSDLPADARKVIQAAKDAALNRSEYNIMRADLKAVGSGAGTVIRQQAGDVFNRRTRSV